MPKEESGEPATEPTEPATRSMKHDVKISELTVAEFSALVRAEVSREVALLLGRLGGATGAHVNSGPPGFVNGGGHANFDPVPVSSREAAGVHVNSGPPGFVNGGGHANFDPVPVSSREAAGVHVNSGPPGFVNGGGHANFDPVPVSSREVSAVHVNSGPPGFVNGGGHANFDPVRRISSSVLTRVTLRGGSRVDLPAAGPVDMRIQGVHIKR